MTGALIVGAEDAGKRLDLLLYEKGYAPSRAIIQRAVVQGHISVNGGRCKPGFRVRPGDTIEGCIRPAEELAAVPQDIEVDILYQDDDIIVVNKPRGMVVHPAAGSREGTLVNALLFHCPGLTGVGDRIRPGIVHRLDKDTTGLLVIAKNSQAHINLSRAIQHRQVERRYLALVYGRPEKDEGIIDAPLGRHRVDRKKMAINPDGRSALTRYRTKERYRGMTLLDVSLMTGRTHQIRVHMAAIGHAVVGDPLYGPARIPQQVAADADIKHLIESLGGQALHAARLTFDHPINGERMDFEAPLPDDMAALLAALDENRAKIQGTV